MISSTIVPRRDRVAGSASMSILPFSREPHQVPVDARLQACRRETCTRARLEAIDARRPTGAPLVDGVVELESRVGHTAQADIAMLFQSLTADTFPRDLAVGPPRQLPCGATSRASEEGVRTRTLLLAFWPDTVK